MHKDKIVVSWSGGKDSTMALYYILKQYNYEIAYLVTTITEGFERVTMHGVRKELIKKQAESLGYQLLEVYIPPYASNEIYEERMRNIALKLISEGITKHVFGDIYLEDVRKYREENLKKLNLEGIWPIWGRDTKELALEFIKLGFKAIVCVVDTKVLDESFVGRDFDEEFISDLPSNVDPCGEKGEFHTFVYDGPLFKREIRFKVGEKVLRDNRFYFIDLIPLS